MGNDIETSEVLSLALVYIVSNNSFAKIAKLAHIRMDFGRIM